MEKKNLILRFALGIFLVLLAVFSALPMIPPRAVSADAPATDFSAERAVLDLAVIASTPHAAGSEAQAKVREYIVGELTAVDLQVELETDGKVTNILVLLPGTDPTGTVLITGHYDSHPPAPICANLRGTEKKSICAGAGLYPKRVAEGVYGVGHKNSVAWHTEAKSGHEKREDRK